MRSKGREAEVAHSRPICWHAAPALGAGLAAAAGASLGGDERRELLRRLAAGELHELEFDAIVFRAGPNRNHLRIAEEELEGFAASFVGAPFLRDHNVGSVEARAGIVVRSALVGRAIRQTIRLTTQRDLRAWLEGQIDRFSVSWFYESVSCSVCGQEWGRCSHRPGRSYAVEGEGARHGRVRARCELLFRGVQGKEVSAVNAPAVEGTQVLPAAGAQSGTGQHNRQAFQLEEAMSEAVGWDVEDVDAGVAVAAHRSATACMPLPSGSEGSARSASVAQAEGDGAWAAALRAQVLDGIAARAGLSGAGLAAVRAALAAEPNATPTRAQALVEAQRASEASALRRTPPSALLGVGGQWPVRGIEPSGASGYGGAGGQGGAIGGMRTAEDEVQAALNWLLGDVRTPMPAPHMRSLRDLYLAVTGDVNFWGVFNSDYARLQSANSGTLAGMAVNALNRAVMLHYDNMLTYRWYEQIVHVLPHDGSTQQIQLVHMDGLATLPPVAEGAAYTEAATGDSKETATFTKYGSYVGITLEMIRRSDIARIQAIPRLLVQAAIRRRSAAIAGIFTANPTLADDSTALFHASHGNSDTTAFSAAAWEAARTRIFEQTAPGTGKPLGLWPTFCLLPIELYGAALTAFGYGSGDVGKPNSAGTAQEPNIYAFSRPGDPRPVPIVVPDWTDATDWAYIVDPRLHPVVVMAYAGAPAGGMHALPELFEVRSETTGLLFSHDTLPVKVRDWWAYGVATHVGVGRNAVTG